MSAAGFRSTIRAIPRITQSLTPINATLTDPKYNSAQLSGYTEGVTTIPIIFAVIGRENIIYSTIISLSL